MKVFTIMGRQFICNGTILLHSLYDAANISEGAMIVGKVLVKTHIYEQDYPDKSINVGYKTVPVLGMKPRQG